MQRLESLRHWLGGALGGQAFELEPASADASFRRYFRVRAAGRCWVAMDAPPDREDCTPFVTVAGLMRDAGLHVPDIVAQDLAQGFLLLSDLGPRTYLQALSDSDPAPLFRDAIAALVQWQAASRPGVLPEYSEALLRAELELFPEWYVGRHLGVVLTPEERQLIDAVFDKILASNLAEPRVFVHHDYMPRNLMVSSPNPGVLDFQDAVYGPISYDIACLYRDAFVSWEEAEVLDGTIRYWEAARRQGLPVRPDFADFWRDVEWMGLQRHLKVLGIFARICHRDGKPAYLEDAPRFLGYVRHACNRYGDLAPLGRLLDRLEGVTPQAAYTF